MIGHRRYSENCSDCEESSRGNSRKQRGTRISRERYEQTDALSPLRSPIRPETDAESKQTMRSKSKQGEMTSKKNVMTEVSTNQAQDEAISSGSTCWKVATPKKRELADEDFPCLDALKFTPEPKKQQEKSKLDWATLAEEFEKEQREKDRENRNRYKRRLLLSDDGEKRERRTSSKPDQRQNRPRNHRKRKNVQNSENNTSVEGTPTKRRPENKPFWQRSPSQNERQKNPEKFEQDEAVLQRRQKQIDLGKSTDGYKGYIAVIERAARAKIHPHTPNKYLKFSRRSWDAQIKIWRRKLHNWDPTGKKSSDGFSDGISDTTSEASLEVSTTTTDVGDRASSSDLVTPPNSQATDGSESTGDVFLDDLLDQAIDDEDNDSKDETITENSRDSIDYSDL